MKWHPASSPDKFPQKMCAVIIRDFRFNTKLAFLIMLYKIDIEGFKKFKKQKIKLPLVGIELTIVNNQWIRR